MKTITRTFQEDSMAEGPLLFIDSVLDNEGLVDWSKERDPAEQSCYLTKKIQITIKIIEQ